MKRHNNPLAADLEHILGHTGELWEDLRGKHLFITGGTGFFGRWLLESFSWANEVFGLNASALVLSRHPEAFKIKSPELASNPAIRFHAGDVRYYDFPEGEFSHIIHAATTSAAATFNKEDALVKFDTTVEGTRRTLDFATRCGAEKVLVTSSGAVYGRQPHSMSHIPEDFNGAPDPSDPGSALGEGKRAAEFLCAYYATKYGFEIKIARCFTFVGPFLQLDIHYAIGNFIRDALTGGPIVVQGDGTPYRSYLYASDLMIWLWTILIKGKCVYPYNVGSEYDVTIGELASIVSQGTGGHVEIRVDGSVSGYGRADRYVPSISRARQDLGLTQTVSLREALEKTIVFYRDREHK